MAGPILNSSVIIDDHFSFPQTSKQVNTPISSTPYKQKKLLCFGKEFTWEGCLDDLRKFVQADLKPHGKWTSPGDEVKLFTCNESGVDLGGGRGAQGCALLLALVNRGARGVQKISITIIAVNAHHYKCSILQICDKRFSD